MDMRIQTEKSGSQQLCNTLMCYFLNYAWCWIVAILQNTPRRHRKPRLWSQDKTYLENIPT